ncbi:MAG: HDOD domain-containing protein [Actinomycetota bacterium]
MTVLVACDDADVNEAVRAEALIHGQHWKAFHDTAGPGALEFFVGLAHVDVMVVHATGDASEALAMLEWVRTESPRTARVALSDTDDRSVGLRLASVAHQVVPLPLEVGALAQLIERVRSATRTELLDPVRTLVGQVDRLPSPPAIFTRMTEILASPDWRIDDLADEIAQDTALTGEILRLVNSSFYGVGREITSITQAVSLIGVEMTRFIVLGNQMFQSSGGFETWIDLDRLANRSRSVATVARALATRESTRPDVGTRAYLAGLVSEIGLLVLARIPDISPSIAAPVNGSAYLGAERVIFGGDRFEVGTHLLTLWGFSDEIIEAVRRLSAAETCEPGELAWFLAMARQLAMGDGLSPEDLAQPAGTSDEVDAKIAAVRAVVEGSTPVAAA